MGRKRKPRTKKREPITISLPKSIVDDFDATLGDRTRSKTIEYLIKRYLSKSQKKIDDFSRHAYSCGDCGRRFTTNRYVDPFLMVCRGVDGCDGVDIGYIGIFEEEE